MHAYSPRGAHRTCVNDLSKSALRSWGWIWFLGSTLNLHDGSSSIQVRRRYVSAYSSLAAQSSSFTIYRRLSTTTSSSVSLCIIFTSDTIFFYKQKVHTTWPIYYCCLSTVLIMIILAMLLAILLLMMPDLTSMLEICMLIYGIVMICILLLI